MKKQKFISLLLSTSMVLTMIPTTAFAIESEDVNLKEQEELPASELSEIENPELIPTEQSIKETVDAGAEEKNTEPVQKASVQSSDINTFAAPSDPVNIPDEEFAKKINFLNRKPENNKVTYEDMANIKSLTINFSDHKITDLEGLQYATNLKELTIRFDCKNIEKIKELKNLEYLKLSDLTDFHITMLDSMPKLTTLDFFYIKDLQNLNGLTKEKFPRLEVLRCWRCKNLEDISALKNQNFPLKEVNFEGYNKLSDITPLAGYTSITDLELEKVTINEKNRESYKNTIRTLTGLRSLSMPYCDVTDADVDMFFPLKNLKKLVLNINNITNTKFCDNLPKDMEVLSLHGNEIKNMDNLDRFDKLKILGMGENSVTDFRFMKNLKNLTNDNVRHAEGDESSPCREFYSIGEFTNTVEIDGDLVVKNPYKDINGNVIPFKKIKSKDNNPTYTVQYDEEKNEIIFHNLDRHAYVYIDYDIPLPNGEVKKFNLYIEAHVHKKVRYNVNYDWGKNAPSNVKLPVDNQEYKTLDEAKKAVNQTFTKDTEVRETVDGIKGVWKFSGWKVSVSGRQVSCTGNWKFYPDKMVINAAPKITATDKVLTVGDKFNELDGVTASDKEDGKLTDKVVVVDNTVDMTKAGTYKVTYKVTDKQGASTQKTINVTVIPKAEVLNHAPFIEAVDKTLTVGDKFDELDGVTAKDDEDGDLTNQIVVLKNDVDTAKAGTYEVIYKVTDKQGASSIKTITVTVKEQAVVPVKPAKPEAPKTGDANNLGLWGMMLFVSSGIAALISKKKKLFK